MEHKENEYFQARNLYFETGFSQQKIAEILNISRRTVYRWMKQGGWKAARYAAAHAPVLLVDQYYHQLGAINMEIATREKPWPTKEESEIIRRLSATIKQVDKGKPGISDTIHVFEAFTETLTKNEKDWPKLKDFMGYMDRHVKKLMSDGEHLRFSDARRIQNQDDRDYEQWLKDHPEDDDNNTNSPDPVPASGDNNGTLMGQSPDGGNPSKPLPEAHIANNDNADLSTKNIAAEEEKHEKEMTIKRANNAAIITSDDYMNYCHILRGTLTTDFNETMEVNGKLRNRMAFEYNLLELRKYIGDQLILTDTEFLRAKTEGLL